MEAAVSATISPEHLLREMSDLWTSTAKSSEGDTSTGVLRACSMTLIVTAAESDDPQDIGETLAALMREHPSRAIVIRLRPSPEPALEARVFAQCWMPFGHRDQICCEQIEIIASAASLPDLPAVVLPLAVPDLPVILWCRCADAWGLPDFPRLGHIAQKVVLDSERFPDSAAILRQMADWQAAGHTLGDLAWTRLTRWRELISQIFENRAYVAALPRVSEIRVSHTGDARPLSAWYLGVWLADGVAKAGGRAQLRFERSPGSAAGRLAGVELVLAEPAATGARTCSILVVGEQGVEVRSGSLVHHAVFPPDTAYSLMREELAIPGPDPVFERTLAAAAALALSSINR
jgi:glucose-6-phosphate dehydrogenase assembly protein OpcA